jgi:hypothetical protein
MGENIVKLNTDKILVIILFHYSISNVSHSFPILFPRICARAHMPLTEIEVVAIVGQINLEEIELMLHAVSSYERALPIGTCAMHGGDLLQK